MTEILEKITAYVFQDIGRVECPFQGEGRTPNNDTTPDPDEDVKNFTYNDSGKLRNDMLKVAKAKQPPEGKFPPFPAAPLSAAILAQEGPKLGNNVRVVPNPHHLVPGHESLPESDVCQYMGEQSQIPEKYSNGSSKIEDGKGGIDYNVNSYLNGVWLPSNNALRGQWSESYQGEYAFLAMNRSNSQFHDRHGDYSDFVVDLLQELCNRLEYHIKSCQLKPCTSERSKNDGKWPPPYPFLRDALYTISKRLRKFMPITASRTWKNEKVRTSRFSGLYADIEANKNYSPFVNTKGGTTTIVNEYAIKVVHNRLRTWARQPSR